jgi:opacity protein-like surface antigen
MTSGPSVNPMRPGYRYDGPIAGGLGTAETAHHHVIGEPSMLRPPSSLRALAVAALVATATAPSAGAQRFELTPFGGYQWGGSFDTDALGDISAGELSEQDSFSWGVLLGVRATTSTVGEIWYLRQDSDVRFDPSFGESTTPGKISNNYVQFGGRQEFNTLARVSPFVSGSLGFNILDSDDLDATWRFAWTLGGGAMFKLPNERVALRLDLRWMATLVPSGEYSTWCSVWGCYAAGGSTLLNQGQASGGLAIAF